MFNEWHKTALRILPLVALAAVATSDPLDLWDSDAEAAGRGHAFPELGPLESDAEWLLKILFNEDARLGALGKAFAAAGIPPTDPLALKLAALNRSQDVLLGSVAQIKAELAVADMSGRFTGNARVLRDTLTQLRVESLGLSSDIDALEARARARGIIR